MAKKKPKKKRSIRTTDLVTLDDINPKMDINQCHMENVLLNTILPPESAAQQRDGILARPQFLGKAMTTETRETVNVLYEASRKMTARMRPFVEKFIQALIKAGIMPSDDELAKLDSIRLPKAVPDGVIQAVSADQANPPQDINEMVFRLLPCFTSGIISKPDGEVESVFIWTVHTVDIEHQVIELSLQHEIHCNGRRVPNMNIKHAFVQVTRDPESPAYLWHVQHKTETHSEPLDLIVSKLSARKLNWTDGDYQFWEDAVIRMARKTRLKYDPDNQGIVQQAVLQEFLSLMILVNYVLGQQKLRRKAAQQTVDTTPHEDRPRPEIKLDTQTPPAETRVNRVLCGIVFSSTQLPKKPSMRTLVQYRTAAWSVRGHVRHYKSGKTAYIQPTVRKRHALKDKVPENKPARQVIELIDPKKEIPT